MLASPLSTTKHSPHVPMKCGYICTSCRMSHIDIHVLLGSQCKNNATGGHNILKRAVQCQNCKALGDCTNEFLKETCLGSAIEAKPVASVAEPPTPPAVASEAASAVPAAVPESRKELEDAQAALQKLQLLKSLEVERMKLQELLLKKTNRGI